MYKTARVSIIALHISLLGKAARVLVKVEIAVPGFVDWRQGNAALSFVGPAFELAVEKCNEMYAGTFNFSLTYLYNVGVNVTTVPDISADLLAGWYYRKRSFPTGLAVITAPGVIDSTNVHQLAASWNILYFQTVVFSKSDYRLPAAPILATMPGFLVSLARGFNTLVTTYAWSTLFMVVDKDSAILYQVSYLRVIARLINNPAVTVQERSVSSNYYEKLLGSYSSLLGDFRDRSRVMFYFARADHVRRLMIDAAMLNMTTGEFVYCTVETASTSLQFQFGNLSWSYADSYDQIAKIAFRSLIVLHVFDTSVKASYTSLLRQIRERAGKEFGSTYQQKDQSPAGAMDSFSTITMFAKVLNESLLSDGEPFLHDGIRLVDRFLNRTFHQEYSEISLDAYGNRNRRLAVSCYSGSESQRNIFLLETEDSFMELEQISDISKSWPGGIWPPLNEPLCGFKQNKKICDKSSQIGLSVGLTTAGLICVILAIFFVRSVLQHREVLHDRWWWLDCASDELLFYTSISTS